MQAYKQVMEGLNFKLLVRQFWSYQPSTPEEIETLADCRDVRPYSITLKASHQSSLQRAR